MNIERKIFLNLGFVIMMDMVKLVQVVFDICLCEKEFVGMMKQLCDDLVCVVYGDFFKYMVVLFCGLGMINIDICLNFFFFVDKKVLVVNNGVYSICVVEVCEYYGFFYIDLKFFVYEFFDLLVIEKMFFDNLDIVLVYIMYYEMGMGILNFICEIGKIVYLYGVVFVVDIIFFLGMIFFDIGKDNVDFCMVLVQKGFQVMMGFFFIIGDEFLICVLRDYLKCFYYCNFYL